MPGWTLKRLALYYIMPMCSEMREKIIYSNNIMSNRNEFVRLLSGIINSELQNLVRVREEARRLSPAPRRRTPIPTPRRNVQQLTQHFEANRIPQYRPIPAPRMKKQQPVAAPRTGISEKRRALKDFTKSFEVSLRYDRDALVQLQNNRLAISQLFSVILSDTEDSNLGRL